VTVADLFGIGPVVRTPPEPREESENIKRARKAVKDAERRVDDAEADLEEALDELSEQLCGLDAWPPKDVLLAVYGAPGNWPCEPA
jgi:hypothetical protein